MRFAGLVTGVALTIGAMPAAAQNFPELGVTTLDGKCTKLVVGKIDASKGCKAELGSVTLPDGTVTFIFSAEGKLLGFQGDGRSLKPGGNGTAHLPLSIVSTGVGNTMTGQVKVAGTCSFGNPYDGKPTTVDCTAKSKDTSFAASFRTSGKPPRHKQ